MRSQVPQDIHVMLEKPQIDTGRIVIVERSEGAFVDKLLNLPDSTCKKKRMVDHDLQILTFCKLDKVLCLGGRRREWFFDEHMLAVLKGFLGQLVVVGHWSHNG